MRKTKKNSKRTKAEENPREKATSQKKERRGRKTKTYEVFYFILFIFLFSITKYLLTILTYLQTIYGTYATNKTILYLQNNTYLQCEILTLLTILTIENLQYLLTMRYLHY